VPAWLAVERVWFGDQADGDGGFFGVVVQRCELEVDCVGVRFGGGEVRGERVGCCGEEEGEGGCPACVGWGVVGGRSAVGGGSEEA